MSLKFSSPILLGHGSYIFWFLPSPALFFILLFSKIKIIKEMIPMIYYFERVKAPMQSSSSLEFILALFSEEMN